MKSKMIMMITVAIICILLTSIMFVQFKTIDVVKKSGLGNSENELRAELTDKTTVNNELEATLEDEKKQLEKYNNDIEDDNASVDVLNEDLSKLELPLGLTNVEGPRNYTYYRR